jgi:hypothetical protein
MNSLDRKERLEDSGRKIKMGLERAAVYLKWPYRNKTEQNTSPDKRKK